MAGIGYEEAGGIDGPSREAEYVAKVVVKIKKWWKSFLGKLSKFCMPAFPLSIADIASTARTRTAQQA